MERSTLKTIWPESRRFLRKPIGTTTSTLDEVELKAQVSNCSLSLLDELRGTRYIESK